MSAAYTLILLPGMLGTSELFLPLLSVLPADLYHRVLEYPSHKALTYDELLVWLEVQLHEVTNMVLLGESFAGVLALRFAADNPGRVRAVVLSASFILPPLPSWIRWLARPWLLRIPLPALLIRIFAAGWSASDELIDLIKQSVDKPTADVLSMRIGESLTVDCTAALSRCGAPILYLAPSNDHLVLRFNLKRILRIRPDLNVARIAGPHLILQRFPDKAWKMIEHFITTTGDVA